MTTWYQAEQETRRKRRERKRERGPEVFGFLKEDPMKFSTTLLHRCNVTYVEICHSLVIIILYYYIIPEIQPASYFLQGYRIFCRV